MSVGKLPVSSRELGHRLTRVDIAYTIARMRAEFGSTSHRNMKRLGPHVLTRAPSGAR